MSINWKALKEQKNTATPLFAIVLGASGSGKSTLIGTLNKPTLYIYTSAESHGPVAAAAMGSKVFPVCIDRDEKGNHLSADDTYKNLLTTLNDKELAENFEAVAVDSATELDMIIRQTNQFKAYCATPKGHNQWKEGEAVIVQLKAVVDSMKKLHAKGIHCFMTIAAAIKSQDESGAVSECTPKLLGFEVSHDLIRQFNDVLLVSRLNMLDEETEQLEPVHALLFRASVTKMSKDMKGTVLKTANFSPRVSGLLVEELPALMKANLSRLLELKAEKLSK